RARRLLERSRRPRPRQEVDVDAADAAGTELDVAGATPVVSVRPLTAAHARDERLRDDARRSLREHARLRDPDRRDIAHRIDIRETGLEGPRVHRHVPVNGHAALEDDSWRAVPGNAEEEVVRQLTAVVEHRDAAGGV